MLNPKLMMNIPERREVMTASYMEHRQTCTEHNIEMYQRYEQHCRRYKHLRRREREMVDHLFDVKMGL